MDRWLDGRYRDQTVRSLTHAPSLSHPYTSFSWLLEVGCGVNKLGMVNEGESPVHSLRSFGHNVMHGNAVDRHEKRECDRRQLTAFSRLQWNGSRDGSRPLSTISLLCSFPSLQSLFLSSFSCPSGCDLTKRKGEEGMGKLFPYHPILTRW